jgi:hypothetical protein
VSRVRRYDVFLNLPVDALRAVHSLDAVGAGGDHGAVVAGLRLDCIGAVVTLIADIAVVSLDPLVVVPAVGGIVSDRARHIILANIPDGADWPARNRRFLQPNNVIYADESIRVGRAFDADISHVALLAERSIRCAG